MESPIKKFNKKISDNNNVSRRVVTEMNFDDKTPEQTILKMEKEGIDYFLEKAFEGKTSDFEFYYMLKQESNDYYNLEVNTYQNIMKNKIQNYFTLSGHGITMYEQSRPV